MYIPHIYMKTIFLSGPIRGLERTDSLSWRNDAEAKLCKDFTVLNPLRNREEKGSFPFPKGIVIRDKSDILKSDIILVNDEFPTATMIGTAMEVIYAHQLDKVIILFGEGHDGDLWLEYHSHMRFKTMDEAIEFIIKMFK